MADADGVTECGLGIRGVAMAIDTAVWFALFFLATFPVAAITGDITTTAEGVDASLTGTPALVALALWFALAIGYHTAFEWRFGKTLGKYLVAIRVVNDDGSPVSIRSSLVRNALRLVDWLPGFYVLGMLLIALSGRNQRLGDRVGDTIVVRD